MKRILRQIPLSVLLLVGFLFVSLFYPVTIARVHHTYSPDYTLPHLLALLTILALLLEGSWHWKKAGVLGLLLAGCLLAFNLSAGQANAAYHSWYMGQINVTLAFLFFLILLMQRTSSGINHEQMLKVLLALGVLATLVSFVPYIMRYAAAVIFNGKIQQWRPFKPSDRYFAVDYSWVYFHKSEYSFILVLFLALTATYRNLFQKKWLLYTSAAILTLGLLIANTRATMAAALFIPAGILADRLKKQAGGFSWKYLLWFLPIAAVGAIVLYFASKERDIWSLGRRTYIWKGFLDQILQAPQGLGPICGTTYFDYKVGTALYEAWNAHNVFLNSALQFSLFAGIFYTLAMACIIIVSIRKNPSFQTAGIWVALLIPMNMDWCIQLAQLPLVLLCFYFLFFRPRQDTATS